MAAQQPPMLYEQGGSTMAVSVVTYRKGGTRETVAAATRKLKAFVEKHGAQDLMLNAVTAGPDAGQWALVLTFADWRAFGESMQSAMSDPAFAQVLSEMDAVAEVVSRRIVVSVDL
jgi:hypothetical protein